MKPDPKDRFIDNVPEKTRRQFLAIISRSLLGISAFLSTSTSSFDGEPLEPTQPIKLLQYENLIITENGWVLTGADIIKLGL